MSTLTESLRAEAVKLVTLRHEAEQRDEAIKRARADFEATIVQQVQSLAGIRREIEATEGAVRGMALVTYDTTGEKKVIPGVEIVIGKEYDIDEAAGLSWARTVKMCLVPEALDLKAVKKMAAVTDLPFVTITEKPSVRIASDLLKKLESDTPMPWDHQEVAA
jgi:hypothetical protein